jgi:hypothetical protein
VDVGVTVVVVDATVLVGGELVAGEIAGVGGVVVGGSVGRVVGGGDDEVAVSVGAVAEPAGVLLPAVVAAGAGPVAVAAVVGVQTIECPEGGGGEVAGEVPPSAAGGGTDDGGGEPAGQAPPPAEPSGGWVTVDARTSSIEWVGR